MPSGRVLIMCMQSCIINDEHIFLSFGKDLHGQSSCHLYMVFQLLQNMASGHVFYMANPSHATESARQIFMHNSMPVTFGVIYITPDVTAQFV